MVGRRFWRGRGSGGGGGGAPKVWVPPGVMRKGVGAHQGGRRPEATSMVEPAESNRSDMGAGWTARGVEGEASRESWLRRVSECRLWRRPRGRRVRCCRRRPGLGGGCADVVMRKGSACDYARARDDRRSVRRLHLMRPRFGEDWGAWVVYYYHEESTERENVLGWRWTVWG